MGNLSSRTAILVTVLVASLIYLAAIGSPPSLMDDVDAVQASISHTMLQTGDWVTPHLDGIRYLEKPPFKYWLIATSFQIFGVHDWAARLPVAIGVVALCAATAAFGAWVFGAEIGLWAGLLLATSTGLWLFTRILISDSLLTLAVAGSLFGLLRALDPDHRGGFAGVRGGAPWARLFWAAMAVGVLIKGFLAVVVPLGTAGLYLLISGLWWDRDTYRRLRIFEGIVLFLLIAAPWHILAILANPPHFDFTWGGGPGHYRGYFWAYFLNEHVFRFLNIRYPRDYNTVPRLAFWLLHLVWLFPWSLQFLGLLGHRDRYSDRESQVRLLCLCWIAFTLGFFTLSTTQEYYSMPCYPAFALLLADALGRQTIWNRIADRLTGVICLAALAISGWILFQVWTMPTPGDIARALAPANDPSVYTLSLGHMGDLTLNSFAYLKWPLLIAVIAFAIGSAGTLLRASKARWFLVLMMLLFTHAARTALIAFDPYLSSRPLAEALNLAPTGQLIVDDQYYTFSSVFFYSNRQALLLNGRVNNLEYGSNAPDAPKIFLNDEGFAQRWRSDQRFYLLIEGPSLKAKRSLVPSSPWVVVKESGGKFLVTNRPL